MQACTVRLTNETNADFFGGKLKHVINSFKHLFISFNMY